MPDNTKPAFLLKTGFIGAALVGAAYLAHEAYVEIDNLVFGTREKAHQEVLRQEKSKKEFPAISVVMNSNHIAYSATAETTIKAKQAAQSKCTESSFESCEEVTNSAQGIPACIEIAKSPTKENVYNISTFNQIGKDHLSKTLAECAKQDVPVGATHSLCYRNIQYFCNNTELQTYANTVLKPKNLANEEITLNILRERLGYKTSTSKSTATIAATPPPAYVIVKTSGTMLLPEAKDFSVAMGVANKGSCLIVTSGLLSDKFYSVTANLNNGQPIDGFVKKDSVAPAPAQINKADCHARIKPLSLK